MRDRYRSWIEISKKNLLGNFSVFKKLAGRANVACVVKANAYGHGINEVVSVLTKKADLFAVDSLEEAHAAASVADNKPILILGYVPTFQLKEAVAADLSLTVYNLETLKDVASLKMKVKVHLKIETGLNRQGINLPTFRNLRTLLKKTKISRSKGFQLTLLTSRIPSTRLLQDFRSRILKRHWIYLKRQSYIQNISMQPLALRQ